MRGQKYGDFIPVKVYPGTPSVEEEKLVKNLLVLWFLGKNRVPLPLSTATSRVDFSEYYMRPSLVKARPAARATRSKETEIHQNEYKRRI